MEITVWKYTMKCTVQGTWKYTVKSKIHGTWNMKNTLYGKYSISLLMPKYIMVLIEIHTSLPFLRAFHVVKKKLYIHIYFLPYCFTNNNFCFYTTWHTCKICWRKVTTNIFMDNFDLVLLKKLTYALSSCPLHTWKLLWRKHFSKKLIA